MLWGNMGKLMQLMLLFALGLFLAGACSRQKPQSIGSQGTRGSIIGNKEMLDEISHIEQLSMPDENGSTNITVGDLRNLEALAKGDKISEDYAKEFRWLVEHNESLHLVHTTYLMREYINTGKDTPCIPHELWHVSLYIRHGDIDYAKSQLIPIEDEYPAWAKSAGEKRKAYPQFYNGLDELEKMSMETIEKLKHGDYSNETLDELDTIGAVELC